MCHSEVSYSSNSYKLQLQPETENVALFLFSLGVLRWRCHDVGLQKCKNCLIYSNSCDVVSHNYINI